MVCSPLWIVYLYLFVLEIIPMAALVTSGLTLAVIATQYVGRKRKLAFLQVFRPYSNIAGGLVTLASVGLPWWVFGVYQGLSLVRLTCGTDGSLACSTHYRLVLLR
ncbi:hypothetical protein E6H23_06825 [Candidatus Bathyarchaeota archaeon]|nr:MAG: hypothetical protein E6H23_06825 [Candidatus Bathyarchaeota archaeon]